MIDERFIIKLNGNSFVKYEGLLDAAHRQGLRSLEVEVIQLPSKDNEFMAICKASAVDDVGGVYVDFGDASPASVNSKIVPHLIRMASTRAKARVLRDLTNIGMCSIEELGFAE